MPDFQPAKFCPGCGYPIILMMLNQALNKLGVAKKAVLGLDIGCALLAWEFLPINIFQTHHGRVVPTMAGYKKAMQDSLAMALVGDGGAYAIGLQSLIYAARRDEPVLVIVVNNTLYAMTGGQSAPTTLRGMKTNTAPEGFDGEPFLGPEFIKGLALKEAYFARAATNEVNVLLKYIEKAIKTVEIGHFALVEVLSFCPTNWKTVGKATTDYLDNLKKTFKIGEF